MRMVVSVRFLLIMVLLIALGGYACFDSDWFQKRYIYPYPYKELIEHYAVEYELDPLLIVSVIRVESKFAAQARSPKGAVGLMQLMPETAEWIAVQLEYPEFQLSDLEKPEVNIKFGSWYLASLKKEFKDNEFLLLAAYNGGRGNVKQWMQRYGWTMRFQEVEQIPFRETKEYVGRVLHDKRRYQQLYGR